MGLGKSKINMFVTDINGQNMIEAETENIALYMLNKEKFREKNDRDRANKILFHKYGGKINMFQYALERASKDLTSLELRIFIYLLSKIDFGNTSAISQSEIAKDLETQRTYINKGIKELERKEFINIEKKNNINFYTLNPELVWKGKQADWLNTIELQEFKKKREYKKED